jgi:hypothetical protein
MAGLLVSNMLNVFHFGGRNDSFRLSGNAPRRNLTHDSGPVAIVGKALTMNQRAK